MTKNLSIAIDVKVSVERYTQHPCENATKWQSTVPNTQRPKNVYKGVKGKQNIASRISAHKWKNYIKIERDSKCILFTHLQPLVL